MIENMMIVPVSPRGGETIEDVIKKKNNNKNMQDIVRVRYDKNSNSDLLWVYILGLRNRRCDIIDVPYKHLT